jgi:electron transfer flavoprotein alpha subunit
VLGQDTREWVDEYIAHGAQKVFVADDPALARYHIEIYVSVLAAMVRAHQPEILLIGATSFGRELAPRLAKRLRTGLTADCIGLEIEENGRLLQIAPSFGGNLIAKIVTPHHRPQMATVRPGIFQEIPHNNDARGDIIAFPLTREMLESRIRVVQYEQRPPEGKRLEDARVVICGGRGMGSRRRFQKLHELARLLGAEVGATRPVVYAGWAGEETLVGQAGRHIKPALLFSFGISGAIQHTAACNEADFTIAVNKDPNATMMKMADVAVTADANQFCLSLIRELKARIRN